MNYAFCFACVHTFCFIC